MQIEIVRKPEELPGFREEWNALCLSPGNGATVFSSYDWYETWWRHFSGASDLHVIAMREAGRLVGIAPLMVRRATLHGLPATVICFIENKQSLHSDFIVLPAVRETFLREVLRLLREPPEDTPWDAVVFNNMPETSGNYHALITILAETGGRWHQYPTWLESPFLVPSGTWADYLAGRSARTRKSLRHIRNNLAKCGDVSVRHIRTWEEFQQVRNDVYSVAKQSWAESHGDSLATPAHQEFFNDLAEKMAKKGWLSLWALYLNGRMIAVEFHLRAFGREHAMRGHYLPAFAPLSPGTFLEMAILENTFETVDRLQKYDFGGSFENYKKKWTDDAVQHRAVWVFNDRPYSRFIAFHEMKTVPLLRRLFPQELWQHRAFRICGISPKRFEPR